MTYLYKAGFVVILLLILAIAIACFAVMVAVGTAAFPPEIMLRIKEYQTVLGAIVAAIVAMGTGLSVFVIAYLPIAATREQKREDEAAQRRTAAAILFADNLTVQTQVAYSFADDREIEPPESFKSFDLIKTQTPDVVRLIGQITSGLGRLRQAGGFRAFMDSEERFEKSCKWIFERMDELTTKLVQADTLNHLETNTTSNGMKIYEIGIISIRRRIAEEAADDDDEDQK